MIKKLGMTLGTLCLGTVLITNVMAYDDVTTKERFKPQIDYLEVRGILDGQGNFNSAQTLTREEYAHWLVTALELESKNNKNKFKDVYSTNKYAQSIKTAEQHGLIFGFDDGTFRPKETLTRGQMTMLLQRAFEFDKKNKVAKFKDIKNVRAKESIETLYSNDIINGFTATEFRPNEKVTKGQGASFLAKSEIKKLATTGEVLDIGSSEVGHLSGEYVIIKYTNQNFGATVEGFSRNESGKLDLALIDLVPSQIYINVDHMNEVTLKNTVGIKVDKVNNIKPKGKQHDGMYKVGVDIPAGKYELQQKDNSPYLFGYYAIHNSALTGDLSTIVKNDNFQRNAFVEVEEGQFLELNNGVIIKKL